MDKFALWPKGLARVLIVGLLAWALVVSGVAAAASSHAVDLGMASADFERCAAGADQHRHSRGSHVACSCCIPCRFDHLDELAGIPPALPKDADLSFPASGVFLVDVFPTVEATPPPLGWISSWSSRAPPIA